MQPRLLLGGLVWCAASALWAQNAPAPAKAPAAPTASTPATAPAPSDVQRIETKWYVRRFSLAITGTLTPFAAFPKEDMTENLATNPPVQNVSNVDSKSSRLAAGLVLQATFTSHWAVAVTPVYRKIGFHTFIQNYVGVDNPNTLFDERTLTSINEDTAAHYLDIPIFLRWYNKEHTERGKRYFYEFGPAIRMVSSVQTVHNIQPAAGTLTVDHTPLPHKSSSAGATAGMGFQLIDDFGIRATPEVRYTHFFSKTFEDIHGKSRSNQVEIVISLGF